MNNTQTNTNIKFGLMIKKLRTEKNLSQEDFAFECGLHRTYIGQIERAEKNISIKNVEKIANALGMDVKDLFDFSKLDDDILK